MSEAFDYVIVGGGSAASVLADRLSADGRFTLCVLEAGPADRNPYIQVPAGFVKTLFDTNITWQFLTEPSARTAGRRIQIAQGKTLGGSSAVNGCLYNRGQRADFDSWSQRGNPGWSYAEILPYFCRTEHYRGGGEDRFRGREGKLDVGTPDWPDPLCEAFMQSAVTNGLPYNADYNGMTQEGVGRYQATIYRGRRISAAKAFLHPASRRANVQVRTRSTVNRIRFDGRRASGVNYFGRGGEPRTLGARVGVIIAAGAINSPKLLQLSGIGSASLLRDHGVELVHHLPGVGENLRDHFSPRLVFRTRGVDSVNNHVRGLALARQALRWLQGEPSVLAIAPAICHGFGKTDSALDSPDFSLVFTPASYKAGRVGMLDDFAGMTCGVWQMRPESHGFVRIQSANPNRPPRVDPGYLTTEQDCRVLVAALKRTRRIFESDPIRGFVDRETLPGADVRSDDEWLSFARQYGSTSYHVVGSCRMGPSSDPSAVVSPELQVHGTEALYIVDSSIMPSIPSSNTYASTLMIAEKGADMILGRPALSPSDLIL